MAATEKEERSMQWLLLMAVFVIATCGLIYELVAGTLASYLLGDSVTQFSTIIGVYLFAMGIGAWLSKYFGGNLIAWFIQIELLVGLVGGFSSCILFLSFPMAASFRIILYSVVLLTGILVGLEIPLLMRILKDKLEFKDLVSRVFTFDYIGALLASLIFPLVLVPSLGLIRTALFFGILNIVVGIILLQKFKHNIRSSGVLFTAAILCLLAEALAFAFSERIMAFSENLSYNENVIYSHSSPYQRIILTRNRKELRLFLNGNLQFSSADEYRYHEALVHPAIAGSASIKNVLVLGGGDGLAVREILKYNAVEKITLVDLDAEMTKIFGSLSILKQLNQNSLENSKVKVINADAFVWLRNNQQQYDCIIVDFPDPSNFSIGKLFSYSCYQLLYRALAPDGVAVIQSTSPFVAPNSYWCVDSTLHAAGFNTVPYHNYVPSFGEWGYIMAMKKTQYHFPDTLAIPLRYLDKNVFEQMLLFPKDMLANKPIAINKLNNQVLVEYFEEEWGKYTEQ